MSMEKFRKRVKEERIDGGSPEKVVENLNKWLETAPRLSNWWPASDIYDYGDNPGFEDQRFGMRINYVQYYNVAKDGQGRAVLSD